jgi:hypothetical protein
MLFLVNSNGVPSMAKIVQMNSAPADTQNPTVSVTAPANGASISGTSVPITANASDNVGVASVQFLLDGLALGSPDTTSPYSFTWDSTTATNGSHTLTAQAKDSAGNTATSSAVTVSVANPPLISNVGAANLTTTGATINWTTNRAATSQVEYGTTTTYGSLTSLDSALVTGHSQVLSGLTASTLYHYRVRSIDAQGNPAVSGDASFTTTSNAPVVLVGDKNIEGQQDYNPAGVAEAFQYTATASGTAAKLYVYLDATNLATKVVVGVYTNTASNTPGTLLGQATITTPQKDTWNNVTLPAISLISGQKYWIAVLGPSGSGTPKFRDVASGGKAQVSAQSNLTSLPATWSSGATYLNSPLSAYVSS